MSSLDRAFFRAYAKEQPAAAAVEAESENVSPYVYYQPQRKPQLRYRIEPMHAPWGQTGVSPPHVDVEPIAEPAEETYLSQEPEQATVPAGWSTQGTASLVVERTPPAPTPPPVIRNKAAITEKIARPSEPSSTSDGIVCLPGMDVPDSGYLAALLAASAATIEPQTVVIPAALAPVPQPEPIVEPGLTPIVKPSLDVEEAVNAKAPPPVQTKQPEPLPVAAPTPLIEPTPEVATETAEETTAFWEVDRYYYPTICDRLLREYDYFSQAGEKLKQAAAAGLKVLGVTGAGRGEGRTTLAICLARAASQAGLKVSLVDCDFQRPLLAQTMGIEVSEGWQSVANGKLALAEVAVRSIDDGITLLPLTSDATLANCSFSDDRVARVLTEAKAKHDVIILDLGPLDPPVVASPTPLDAAIVVWDGRRRQLDEVQTIARALHAAGVEAVGIAENFAHE